MQTRGAGTEPPSPEACEQKRGPAQGRPGISLGPELEIFHVCPTPRLGVTWEPRQLIQHRCRSQEGGNFSSTWGGMAVSLAHFVLGRRKLSTPTLRPPHPRRTGRFKHKSTKHSELSIAFE